MLLHRNDNRQVEEKLNRCLSNRSDVTKTFHNTPEARHTFIPINNNSTDRDIFGTEGNHIPQASPMQLVCLSCTQEGYSADSRGLPTVPVGLTHGERTRAAGNSTIISDTNPGIAAKLVRRCKSEDILSRSGVLQQEEKSAHLIGAEEQDILQVPMEGNFNP